MKRYKVTFFKLSVDSKGNEVTTKLGSVEVLHDPKDKTPISALAFKRATLEQCQANSIQIKQLS